MDDISNSEIKSIPCRSLLDLKTSISCHTYSFVLCSLYDMPNIFPVAIVFKGLDSQRPAVTSVVELDLFREYDDFAFP